MLSLETAAAKIRTGELKPNELAVFCLEKIDVENASLNCFVTVLREEALRQAAEAEE
ncbi:MAG: amidase [Candidatus Caldarchaeum sp.]|nr:amidase [Candidatus Caldarchaeum sp.]MCS7137380.1 amidase [Candidatus Caldarchaeum sp.]MDW7978846.1 hypothetical protein [Candidatus Caldarchaeum sp.]MDW8359246.1 hypothetical protein [Candidatus Caldarchaeum sp.]